MPLNIETFSNAVGGNAFYKAITHPLAAEPARALLTKLKAGGPVAIYDPHNLLAAFDALFRDKSPVEDQRESADDGEEKQDTSDGECITLVLGDWKRSKGIQFQNQWERGLPGTPVAQSRASPCGSRASLPPRWQRRSCGAASDM